MIDPADVPTIESILRGYGLDDMLTLNEFETLLDELRNRENILVTDLNPKEADN